MSGTELNESLGWGVGTREGQFFCSYGVFKKTLRKKQKYDETLNFFLCLKIIIEMYISQKAFTEKEVIHWQCNIKYNTKISKNTKNFICIINYFIIIKLFQSGQGLWKFEVFPIILFLLGKCTYSDAYLFQGYNDEESEIDQNIVKQLEELNNDD